MSLIQISEKELIFVFDFNLQYIVREIRLTDKHPMVVVFMSSNKTLRHFRINVLKYNTKIL